MGVGAGEGGRQREEIMVGGTGFSWADEVEKEEALQSQIEKKKEEESLGKKPNPFGSARPREVVLQERGIDWRSLDTSFHGTGRVPGYSLSPFSLLYLLDDSVDSR